MTDVDREAELAAEEASKWRCRLLIKIKDKVDQNCKCVFPVEFKEKWLAQRSAAREKAAAPVPKIKIKLPVASPSPGPPKRFKRWPTVPGVPFPGRPHPVSILIKLGIPAGHDTDSEAEEARDRIKEEEEEEVVEKSFKIEKRKRGGDEDTTPRSAVVKAEAGSTSPEGSVGRDAGKEGRGRGGGEEAQRRQEHLRRRKELMDRDKDQKTASTIQRILNQEGQAKRREEKQSKRRRDQDDPVAQPSRRRVEEQHLRYVSSATAQLLAFSPSCKAAEWVSSGGKERAKVEYAEAPVVLSVPWWNVL